MAASTHSHNKNSMSLDQIEVIPEATNLHSETTDIHQQYVTPQRAAILKETIFDLLKAGDINHDEQIDWDEFKAVITNFLPDTSEDKMREMFNQLDSNGDGTISYIEFLDDDNFNQFLQYCGYFTSNVAASGHQKQKESITKLTEMELNRQFSVRNQHDGQIIQYQKDLIGKLSEWIQSEGKPAVSERAALREKLQELQIERDHAALELAQLRTELQTRGDERAQLQQEVDGLRSDKMELAAKLKNERNVHQDATKTLEEYGAKDDELERVQNENQKLMEQLGAMKRENRKLTGNNERFQQRIRELTQQKKTGQEEYGAIESEVHEHQDMITSLRDQLEEAQNEIAVKEEVIDNLEQKLSLFNMGNTMDLIANQSHGVAQMVDNKTMKVVASQVSLRTALSPSESKRHFDAVDSRMDVLDRDSSSALLPLGQGTSGIDLSSMGGIREEDGRWEEEVELLKLDVAELKERMEGKDAEIESLRKGVEEERRAHQDTKDRLEEAERKCKELGSKRTERVRPNGNAEKDDQSWVCFGTGFG